MTGNRNIAASVRQRLLNIAKERGEDFQQVLVRFALERLLYRLAQSPYHDRFVLKGALLYRLWFALERRPTRDADFLGFGDAVTPDPLRQTYPTLLEMPAPVLAVYPPETVVAEKLEAMVKLAAFNSRLKDFFDLWVLLRYEALDRNLLPKAIRATFVRRNTPLPTSLPVGLSDEFAAQKEVIWQAFLTRNALDAPPLAGVISILRNACWPLLQAARNEE